MRVMLSVTMRPVGANGDSDPEFAPLPTMIAIRNGEIRIRSAVAIAIGASSPVVAMLPGPADASAAPRPKYMIGTTPTRPRQSRIALCATMSSVPLTCACANSNVTPDNVRNRSIGNPAKTSWGLKPPTKTPMTQASASASSPTLSREMQETMIASASAASVTAPRLNETFSCADACALHSRAPNLEGERQHGDHDDADGHQTEIFLDERNVSREVAQQTEAPHPQDAAADVEREEARIVHATDARDERRKRAHDRHEPREHDCLAAVHLVEALRSQEVLAFQPFTVLGEYARTDSPADEIVRVVSDDRGSCQQGQNDQEVDDAGGRERADSE